jgi:hypothetical protein
MGGRHNDRYEYGGGKSNEMPPVFEEQSTAATSLGSPW